MPWTTLKRFLLSKKYYEPKEMTLPLHTGKHLKFFHLNISSFPFHFEVFSALSSKQKLSLNFVGKRESRLKLSKSPINSIQVSGYNTVFWPTEFSNAGTLVYIKKDINYKLWKNYFKTKKKTVIGLYTDITLWNFLNLINTTPQIF